jgi:hypothetical protein
MNCLMQFLNVSKFGWIFCVLGLACSSTHAQSTLDEQMLSIDRLSRAYLSDEFSPINHQLIFPTLEPNLAQRTDQAKATKLQIQALNIWQKEFDIRFQKVIDGSTKVNSSNALVFQTFADSVRSIYEKLRRKEVNFATANQALLAAQKKLVLESEDVPKISKDSSLKTASTPTPMPPQTQAPAALPIVSKTPIPSKSINIPTKNLCAQKLVLLDALLLEEENWNSVTSSLNQSLKTQSDRELAQRTQDIQSLIRQEKVRDLSIYRAKHCN